MKVIYLRQVSKEHISFVLQDQRDQVAEFRVVQLRKVTLEEAKPPNNILSSPDFDSRVMTNKSGKNNIQSLASYSTQRV